MRSTATGVLILADCQEMGPCRRPCGRRSDGLHPGHHLAGALDALYHEGDDGIVPSGCEMHPAATGVSSSSTARKRGLDGVRAAVVHPEAASTLLATTEFVGGVSPGRDVVTYFFSISFQLGEVAE